MTTSSIVASGHGAARANTDANTVSITDTPARLRYGLTYGTTRGSVRQSQAPGFRTALPLFNSPSPSSALDRLGSGLSHAEPADAHAVAAEDPLDLGVVAGHDVEAALRPRPV